MQLTIKYITANELVIITYNPQACDIVFPEDKAQYLGVVQGGYEVVRVN